MNSFELEIRPKRATVGRAIATEGGPPGVAEALLNEVILQSAILNSSLSLHRHL
jgi:hypothetical protein